MHCNLYGVNMGLCVFVCVCVRVCVADILSVPQIQDVQQD